MRRIHLTNTANTFATGDIRLAQDALRENFLFEFGKQ